MRPDEFRSKFFIYVCTEPIEEGSRVTKYLLEAGYAAEIFLRYEDLLERIPLQPPHVVVLIDELSVLIQHRVLENIRSLSDEILIYVVDRSDEPLSLQRMAKLDLHLRFVPGFQFELLKALDVGTKYLFARFQNDSLVEALKKNMLSSKSSAKQPAIAFTKATQSLSDWMNHLEEINHHEEAIRLTVSSVYEEFSTPVVYLRYYSAHKSFIISEHKGVDPVRVQGTGLDLRNVDAAAIEILKSRPKEYPKLSLFVQTVLERTEFEVIPLLFRRQFKGLLIVLTDHLAEAERKLLEVRLKVTSLMQDNLSMEKKYQSMAVYDSWTETYHRSALTDRINQEISGSRRTGLPVSLILVEVDQDIRSEEYDEGAVLKSLSLIMKRTSRQTDVIGRMGQKSFALLLPHTPLVGAIVKAERLRRIVEITTLTKNRNSKITIGVGVSEYPSRCLDSAELISTADDVLLEVKKAGGNRVSVANVSEDFVPDRIPFTFPTQKAELKKLE